MKSIKEKAEERAPYTKTNSWDRIKAAINAQTSFEAGANYVLGEIESLMKDVSDKYPRFQQGEIIHGRLINLLEQLKK